MTLPEAIAQAKARSIVSRQLVAVYRLTDSTGLLIGFSTRLVAIQDNRNVETATPVLHFRNGIEVKE